MTPLTKKQERIVKLAERGGTDKDLLILDEISALEEKFDTTIQKILEAVPDMNKMMGVLKSVRGDQGERGASGEDSVVPGPQGEQGLPGERGFDGKNGVDGKNGIDGIDGIDGKNGTDGTNGKDGSPDTPGQVRDKLELLEGDDRLALTAIKGLEEEIKKNARTTFIGGRVGNKYLLEVPTGTVNGSNTVFTLSKSPEPTLLLFFVNGQLLKRTEDYTLAGKAVTLTVAPPTTSILQAHYAYF